MTRTGEEPGVERPVRYGVVGLGWFAQAAVLPAFAHARRNSELAALFSRDRKKLDALGEKYGVEARYASEELEAGIESEGLDAIYIVVPNHLHREYTERAAAAGAHVLCEKPMAVTEEDCRVMLRAAREAGVLLMIAYRLHFEQANLKAMELVRAGRIGEPRVFEATSCNRVMDAGNIRLNPLTKGGGSLYDIGIYCINAARHAFQDEPLEVMALTGRADRRLVRDFDGMAGAMLRFPGDRLAVLVSSFGAADHDHYTVHGTEGWLRLEPAFRFRPALRQELTIDGTGVKEEFPEGDQVAPEILHFSDCIVAGRVPGPSGAEGLADVRILEALHRSAARGEAVRLHRVEVGERTSRELETRRPVAHGHELIHAGAPG